MSLLLKIIVAAWVLPILLIGLMLLPLALPLLAVTAVKAVWHFVRHAVPAIAALGLLCLFAEGYSAAVGSALVLVGVCAFYFRKGYERAPEAH